MQFAIRHAKDWSPRHAAASALARPARFLGEQSAPPRWVLCLFLIAYSGTVIFAALVAGHETDFSLEWGSAAILLVALVRRRPSEWLVLLVLAFVANMTIHLAVGLGLATCLLFATLSIFEAAAIAVLYCRYRNEKCWYLSFENMLVLALAIALPATIVSSIGSAAYWKIASEAFFTSWGQSAYAHVLGITCSTPLYLTWTEKDLPNMLPKRRLVECLILTAGVGVLTAAVFTATVPFPFVIFPLLVILTLRAGLLGAIAGAMVSGGVAHWYTFHGQGPIAAATGSDLFAQTQHLELYFLATALSTLPIAIILGQRAVLAAEIKRQVEISDAALENMAQGLCLFDGEDRLVTFNQQYVDLYGLPKEAIRPGALFAEILDRLQKLGLFPEGIVDPSPELAERKARPVSRLIPLHDGRMIEIQSRPLADGGWVATHEDVTERIRSSERINYLATHDLLTRLPNRAAFVESLERAFEDLASGAAPFALHTMDLDLFKEVNDTLGHWAGDRILQQINARLAGILGSTDIAARVGGDEFCILQPTLSSPATAVALAARLVDTLRQPFEFDGHSVVIGATVGVAIAPKNAANAEDLMRRSDLALYSAKKGGRGTYRLFEPAMEDRLRQRRQSETELAGALANAELEVYYQPILRISSDELSGFEALLRWRHPSSGLLSPSDFIPLAEETGMIVPIGEWVLNEACRDAQGWIEPLKVSVNLSPTQCRQSDLFDRVQNALSNACLTPDRLELEITESVLLNDEESVRSLLGRFRILGVGIAMDDFGTGYSSLSYLRSFPFSRIKIDKSFVRDITSAADCRAIVQATIALAKKLNMSVTAEGVEGHEQLRLLQNGGCSHAQGYYISPPIPAFEVNGFIRNYRLRSLQRPAA